MLSWTLRDECTNEGLGHVRSREVFLMGVTGNTHYDNMASLLEDPKESLPNQAIMNSRIKTLVDKISSVSERHGVFVPRLVAVSKTKPVELIRTAYDEGLRHFGENYVQELVEKANHPLLRDLDIRWHFIGNLQRNKANLLVTGVPNGCLWMIETVNTRKLATSLDNSWRKLGLERKLKVTIQVNSSGEESKHGCPPEEVCDLTRYIAQNCLCLDPVGLMTIGRMSHDYEAGPNPDFELMQLLREEFVKEMGVKWVELSMGMSADFEHAIASGSTNIRIGSTIFGPRIYKQ